MSSNKLSSRQLAKLAVLETFPSKFATVNRLVEEMASVHADEMVQRRLVRTLDEMKGAAGGVGASALADTLGMMAMLARRTGGLQTRVRGLREATGSLKVNFEGAMKAASTPGVDADGDEPPVPV